VDFAAMRRLQDVIGKVNGCRSVVETLRAVVEGVVEVVGFGAAAVSLVHADGTFEVLAVAGDSSARAELLGQREPADAYDTEFALAEPWGSLLFVPHERLPGGRGIGWVPDIELLDVPDAWHPQDALFAPLRSPVGELVGMLSVDLPRDGRRPGMAQRELLEMFAAQAGIAIDNARLSERLRASEEAFRLTFERAGIGMAVISLVEPDAGRYLRVNPALCRIVGRTEEELLRLRFLDITHPEDRDRDVSALRAAIAGGPRVYQAEKRYLRADGSTVWAAVTSSVVLDPDGGVHRAIVHIEDISERRAAREDLAHRAGHDDLTGLPNRHTLRGRLGNAISAVNRGGQPGALLFCDIDRFKHVNDSHGHAAGDRVLIVIAQRLAGTIRRGDTVARLSGDEFVVLAEAITPAKAQHLATRLRRAVAAPIVVDQVLVRLSMSIGVAHLGEHRDPDAVIRQADRLMYEEKSRADMPRSTGPSGSGSSSTEERLHA
jgi:diguanylate cyclase (GGDEF)-like protein/PAS domain S-box-containing protein